MKRPISYFWWLVLPILVFATHTILEPLLPESTKMFLFEEGGAHESTQSFVMICATFMALRLMLSVDKKWLKLWFAAAALGSFYVAGEEISWGQWLFHWDTPKQLSKLNDQNETNLHNMSDWLDQKPFTLLSIMILVGGLFVPLLGKFRPSALPEKYSLIYADERMIPTTLIALALKLIDTYNDATRTSYFWRISEILEIYIYYAVFIYLFLMTERFISDLRKAT